MMLETRWPRGAIVKNLITGGMALGIGLLIEFLDPLLIFRLMAWGMMAAGIASLAVTLRHKSQHFVLNDSGLYRRGPGAASIAWPDLERLDLKYLNRRAAVDESRGIFLLTLTGAGKSIRIDSQIHDFSHFLRICAARAVAEQASMSQSTISNLDALGVPTTDWDA